MDELEMIEAFDRQLTKRQLAVLRMMADAEDRDDHDASEMVFEGRVGFVDLEPVGRRTFYALLRACSIFESQCSEGPGKFEIYVINETGRALIGRQ